MLTQVVHRHHEAALLYPEQATQLLQGRSLVPAVASAVATVPDKHLQARPNNHQFILHSITCACRQHTTSSLTKSSRARGCLHLQSQYQVQAEHKHRQYVQEHKLLAFTCLS